MNRIYVGEAEDLAFETRFWERYVLDRKTLCWNWTGCATGKGHGQLTRNWKRQSAHRTAYELFYGPIKGGLWVLHKCNNARCINPSHLYLGDHNDNMRDLAVSGRHPNRVLSDDDVRRVRAMRGVMSGRDVAKLFGVSAALVSAIQTGRSRAHVQ